MFTIDTDGMLSFAPISFDWGDGLRVSLGPFQWQSMPLRIAGGQRADWEPLQAWFWHWFREDEEGSEDGLLGAVHFLSDPEVSGTTVRFEIDLGSAPVEAFEGLLDAVAALDVEGCEIGQAE